jgi:putative endonuclease
MAAASRLSPAADANARQTASRLSSSQSGAAIIVHVYSVYIVRCADGSLYTGLARDPEARVSVHNSGKGAKYTAARLPVALVYTEACATRSDALKREYEIKTWSRAAKEVLIGRRRARAAARAKGPKGARGQRVADAPE